MAGIPIVNERTIINLSTHTYAIESMVCFSSLKPIGQSAPKLNAETVCQVWIEKTSATIRGFP